MAAGDTSAASLEYTPTWALATVCFFFIFISVILEHLIHLITNWLKRRRKTALGDAVDRLKSELMLLGFMSLILAATQESISNICIPSRLADVMLPCRKEVASLTAKMQVNVHFVDKFMWNISSADRLFGNIQLQHHRLLADDAEDTNNDAGAASDSCGEGKVSLMSTDGIHQLHIFIFVLGVTQIVYSVLTMALGRAKMRRWKAWEKETQTTEYQVANDPYRFRFTRQTTFGRRHVNSCTETSVHLWIKSFFRQFFNSVAKVDYLTLRHGFISAHLSTRSNNFNFQKYIQRSLEEDFKMVVGISPLMWFVVVIFLLVDVHGWHVFLWVSFIPLVIVLAMGAKLEVIVARMAIQISKQSSVIVGTPLVQPNDNLFWFGHPRFVLTLLHFTLFTNAFEFAFFIWVTIQFGVGSCYHERTEIIVIRVVLAVAVQFLCSYITLPLYALVTQMGSQFKSKVLEEQIAKIIKQWHVEVRERRKKQEQVLQTQLTSLSAEWSSKRGSPTDLPCFPRPSPSSTESLHLPNKGKTSEQQETVTENEAGTSRGPLRALMIDMPTMRKE